MIHPIVRLFLYIGGDLIYNFKIINYPNGSTQIRVYEELVNIGGDQSIEYDTEPFSGTEVRCLKGDIKRDPQEILQNSLSRTKRKISDYARCCCWEWFTTFTFDPKRTDRTDFKICSKRIRQWCNNMRKRYAPNLQYLVIPEMHTKNQDKYGACWHFHVLMSNIGDIQMVFSNHIDRKSGKKIYNVGHWKWGFSTAMNIGDGETHRVSRYILKYITKQSHLLSKGSHRYYVSNNLPEPEIITCYVDPGRIEEEIQMIADSLGKNIIYTSEKEGFINVKYIELE